MLNPHVHGHHAGPVDPWRGHKIEMGVKPLGHHLRGDPMGKRHQQVKREVEVCCFQQFHELRLPPDQDGDANHRTVQ